MLLSKKLASSLTTSIHSFCETNSFSETNLFSSYVSSFSIELISLHLRRSNLISSNGIVSNGWPHGNSIVLKSIAGIASSGNRKQLSAEVS